jgi:hypothetical protein
MLLVVALSALVAVAGCGGGTEESAPPGQTLREAPEVEGVTIEGERISLEDFKGRPVFVNVWSSW